MYGSHAIPKIIKHKELKLEVEVRGKKNFYRRFNNDIIEKENVIIGTKKKILILPVEPLLLPKEICSHLLLELSQPLTLEPHIRQDIYLTFPIEIGVFIQDEGRDGIIDIFSYNTQKYTLYGDPRQGVLCRYWKSEVYFEEPELDPLYLGLIKLKLINGTANWVNMTKCVFNAYGLKIFYNKSKALIEAQMKIIDTSVAEVDISNKTVEKKMSKAHELITRRMLLGSSRFVMLEGI